MTPRQVVLVPGLWMPSVAMALFSARLASCGYKVHLFAYRGRGAHEPNVDALALFACDKTLFVGHSLGGVLVLDMLNRYADVQANAVVLIGAPVRGCLAGRRFGRTSIGRWMMGASRPLWDERAARWTRGAPLGVIAGTLPLGLGSAFGTLPGPSDGVVRVEETSVEGMAGRALVRRGHSMLVVSGEVAQLAGRFLACGRFA